MPAPPTVDIVSLIDRASLSGYQKLVLAIAGLCVIVDGMDSQLIGYAVPSLLKEFHQSRAAFAPVLAAGLVGMAFGSACGGLVADRLGRRAAILASLILFGLGTYLVGWAPNLLTVAGFRFLAGLGIGGALPSVSTLAAEFTPARHRTLIVTATVVCVPLGGMFAGLLAGVVLPHLGWRFLFWIGGLLPLILAGGLMAFLPESPKFLAQRDDRQPRLARLLARMGCAAEGAVRYVETAAAVGPDAKGLSRLFRDGRASDTLAIWIAFFACLLAVYGAFSWLPTALAAAGWSVATATSGLTAYNIGGVLGALTCAVVIRPFGSRWPMLLCCAGGTISAAALVLVGPQAGVVALLLSVALHGFCVNAVQSTLYAVCAHIYPTAIRATGTATALTVGRLGSILSAFGGAAVMAQAGVPGYLWMLAAAMMLALVALAFVRGHIPAKLSGHVGTPEAAPS